VDQFAGLFLNRFDNFRVAVSRRADGDPCRKIEENVSINVFDNCAASPLCNQGILPRIGRRHEFAVLLHDALGKGSGQLCYQARKFHFRCRNHLFLLN
jgi:hypothetical protein